MANTPPSTVPTGTLGATDSVMVALFQQFLQNQTQSTAAQASKRQLPVIEKIKRQEDFPVWRDKLVRVLKRHNLDKYVLTDVPQPESHTELKQWLDDRADVDDYLQAAVGDLKIWTILKGMGWNSTDLDPKKTFDKLTQYFERGSVDGNATLNQELATIRRDKFASMEAFQARINYLKNRLQAEGSAFRMPDEGYIWMTLKGIAYEYPDLYNRCTIAMQNKTLTWSTLMEELQCIAVTENMKPALTTIKIDRKDDNATTANSKKSSSRGTCDICKKSIFRDGRHCNGCGSHISKKAEECWWCDPEKAPDSWHNKETARLKKAERQRSTAAPLHQQSGIANASTSKPPTETLMNANGSKSVLYTTNLLRLPTDMSFFQEGPQRK